MGIFAEMAHYSVSDTNRNANSLLAFETLKSSWSFIVTREYQDYSHIPVEQHIRIDECRVSIKRPDERIWENVQHKPYWAIYMVPWNTCHEHDMSLGMIPFVKNEIIGKTMTRLHNLSWRRLQTFLSEMQYPFLSDIKTMSDPYLVLHQKKWKHLLLNKQIIERASSPQRLIHFLDQGYSIDEWCI